MGKPILCLDFDGVIHSYSSGWKGAHFIPDPPVPGAMAFLIAASKDFELHVFSSRSNQEGGIVAMQSWLDHWLDQEFGWDKGVDAVTAANGVRNNIVFDLTKPAAMVTIDDRALTFDGAWPDVRSLLAFKPWNKRLRIGEMRSTQREDGIPARIDMSLMSPAELAITHAMAMVEKSGASIALTEAVTLLAQARDRVADHVEELP